MKGKNYNPASILRWCVFGGFVSCVFFDAPVEAATPSALVAFSVVSLALEVIHDLRQ